MLVGKAMLVGAVLVAAELPPRPPTPEQRRELPPRPPTPEQRRVFDRAAASPAAAAAAARGDLEALLARDTPLSYEEFAAQLATVELVTNFNARPSDSFMLMDLALAERHPYKPNPWEALFTSATPEACANETTPPLYELQDDAERRVYGYDGFAAGFCPASFAEAADRPVYVALNWHRFDLGNPAFGDVGVVLRRVAASTDKILETRARYGILETRAR